MQAQGGLEDGGEHDVLSGFGAPLFAALSLPCGLLHGEPRGACCYGAFGHPGHGIVIGAVYRIEHVKRKAYHKS